jgi:glucokinase
MFLAGDVGGTKTALALFEEREGRPLLVREATLPSQDFVHFIDIVKEFLATAPGGAITTAWFGVAGPVVDGCSVATNLPWRLDEKELAAALGARRVRLLNDLEAMGHGVLALPTSALLTLQAGRPRDGHMVLIAAGTGLGEALLIRGPAGYSVIASEGGHTDFGPRTDVETAILTRLRRAFGRVSYERLLSGPGLLNIYRCLREASGEPEPPWLAARLATEDPSAAVSTVALERADPVCVQALDVFAAVYGAEAGNLALKALALGGVFLGGGIAPKIRPKLEDGTFIAAFTDKGRLTPLMEGIPVHLVLEPRAGLLGAARLAASLAGAA